MNRKSKILVLAGAVSCLSVTAAWASETITYTYDERGRLVKAARTGAPTGNVDASYAYDGADNRANVTVGAFQILTGTSGDDVLQGGPGNDQISGLGANDRLYGNDGADTIDGGSGADELYGGTGNDTLAGGEHNDRLDGGPGADTMTGGTGHDTYIVDNAGDVAIEGGSGGVDTVESSVDFNLPTHFERLVLTGALSIDGRGNTAANRLTGNSHANFLIGLSGDDELFGEAGNDFLYGSEGNDRLTGGPGVDFFKFNTAPGSGNVDTITDYSVGEDRIDIASYAFTAMGPNGTLPSTKFHAGTAAADASDRIIYDSATGNIWYDADGTGSTAAILFAKVTPGTALTNTEFKVYD